MRSAFLRPFLALALALAVVLPGTAASAHTSLSSTDPEQGAEVTDLEQVTLQFTGAVLDLGTTLVLVQGGDRITLEPTFPTETTVAADVPALAAGEWSLLYRVVAEDGHPLEGQVDFTVVGSEGEPSGSATADAPEATASATADPTPVSAELPSPTPSASAISAEDTESHGTGGWARFAGAAVLIAVAAGVILWLRRRDSGTGPTADDSPDGQD